MYLFPLNINVLLLKSYNFILSNDMDGFFIEVSRFYFMLYSRNKKYVKPGLLIALQAYIVDNDLNKKLCTVEQFMPH